MDFVDPPFGGEGVEVPLVGSTVMGPDESAWLEYCKRSSMVNTAGKLDVTRPQEEVAGFIQSWLYFGLLAVLSDKTIDGHDFSTPGKRWSTVISSELVTSTLIDMKLSVLRLPRDKCMHMLERHKTLLVKADEAARWAEGHFTENSSKLLNLILLSVKVLIGTIAHSYDNASESMFEQLCGTSLQWYDIAQRRGDCLKAADRALETTMIENGWCVHQIRKLLSTFSYQTAYYFARLPRPRSGRLGHETCSSISCRGWDSKPGSTRARHANEACSCQTITVSSREVAEVIRSGQIPLVSIEEDVHGTLSLKLHTRERSSKYVAISHVWADGLGNAFENGLPACQLRMLQTYLGQISSEQSSWFDFQTPISNPLFWMDTLCIPVQVVPPGIPFSDEDLGDIKGKAIDKMNIVYSCSSHTLVLDDEMRMIPMSADHPTKLAYSQCCGWTTRSWTLQEGCLPPSTVYALADGVYSDEARRFGRQFTFRFNLAARLIAALLGKRLTTPSLVMASRGLSPETVARSFSFSVHRDIWVSFSTRSFNIWGISVYNSLLSKRTSFLMRTKYAKIWNELLDRASSQPADTPAIFANLVGVSAYEVLKRETEQKRVALIIRQQTTLPIEMLYNTGPRLRERLHTQRRGYSRTAQSQEALPVVEDTLEESIGLLNMSEPQTETFKNGWVPAMIGGDRISQPLKGELYLQVLDHCLQIHENDREQYPSMYTTTELSIPTSAFVLNPQCQGENSSNPGCTDYNVTVVTRITDFPAKSAQEGPEEAALGHCFIYDPGSMLAMSKGLASHAQGVHLVILAREGGRITTRYSDPIRLNRITKKRQSLEMLPTVNCNCSVHGTKEFVEILYDAEDLGPLLSAVPKSPGQMFLEHWFNPFAIFAMHGWFSGALKPYIGQVRSRSVTVMWFVMPLIVYLHQHVIMKGSARRLFLEPLNDRGQLDRPSKSWTGDFRRRLDVLIVAPWSVILAGPVLDCLFWLILKGSEGTQATIHSKKQLIVATLTVSYWYLFIGTKDCKFTMWYYFFVTIVFFAAVLHEFTTSGLTAYGLLPYLVLFFNLWIFTWSIKYLRRDRKP